MKRITFWPQLFLGIVFNWGIIICSVEFFGTITKEFFIFYLACIFWTIGYDTIYAFQDLKDDIKNKIKSTAVLFGDKGKYLVLTSYTLMFLLVGYLSFLKTNKLVTMFILIIIVIFIFFNLLRWDYESESNSGKIFRQNNTFGAMIFLYLLSF